MALESNFQRNLINEIKDRFPDSIVLKNDSGYKQGIPDLSIFYKSHWAWLECKKDKKAYIKARDNYPNQARYVEWANKNSFGSYIYPENKNEVLDAMEKSFKGSRRGKTRVS